MSHSRPHEGGGDDSTTKGTFQCSEGENTSDNQHILPILPPSVLVGQVCSFLNRPAWNRLSVSCKSIHDELQRSVTCCPPWPSTITSKRLLRPGTITAALTSNGRMLAVGYGRKWIQLVDCRIGWYKTLNTNDDKGGHCRMVTSLAFSPTTTTKGVTDPSSSSSTSRSRKEDVHLLASSCAGGKICLWNVVSPPHPTQQEIIENDDIPQNGSSSSCCCVLKTTWQASRRSVDSLIFSPNGEYIASFSKTGSNSISIWCVTNGTCIQELNGHTKPIRSVCFANDGLTLVSVSCDLTIRVWNLTSISSLRRSHDDRTTTSTTATVYTDNTNNTPNQHQILARQVLSFMSFSPNGLYFARQHKNMLQLCPLFGKEEEECRSEVTFKGHTDWISGVLFTNTHQTSHHTTNGTSTSSSSSSNDRVISASHDLTIRVWNIATGHCERVLQGHNMKIETLALSHDSRIMTSIDYEKLIRFWNL